MRRIWKTAYQQLFKNKNIRFDTKAIFFLYHRQRYKWHWNYHHGYGSDYFILYLHLSIPLWLQNCLNTLRPIQNGRHFSDDIFKCIFLNENVWISIKIPVKLVPKGPINNMPALFQIMAWRRPGAKPLSETMMVILLRHICVTRPQWVERYVCYVFSNIWYYAEKYVVWIIHSWCA